MPTVEISSRLDLARTLAIEASKHTLAHFPRVGAPTDLGIERKRDGSIVTVADKDAESFIRDRLAVAFPKDAVLGEELGAVPGTSGYRWVIDPIDGTASFACGVPLFGTIIGVELTAPDSSTTGPVAGAVSLPGLDEVIWGAPGLGAWHAIAGRETPARVSNVDKLKNATVVTTSLDYFVRAGNPEIWTRIQAASGQTRGWSDCYAFSLLATGRIDALVEPLVKPWDICGAMAIIEAAGGLMTDFVGRRRIDSGNALVTNAGLHKALLEILRK